MDTLSGITRDAVKKQSSNKKHMILSVEGHSCNHAEDTISGPDSYIKGGMSRGVVPSSSPNDQIVTQGATVHTKSSTSTSSSSCKQQSTPVRHGTVPTWKTPGEIAIVIGRAKNRMKVSPGDLPHTLQCFAVKFTGMWKNRKLDKHQDNDLPDYPGSMDTLSTGSLAFHTQKQCVVDHHENMTNRELATMSSTSLRSSMRGRKRQHNALIMSPLAKDFTENLNSTDISTLTPSVKLPSILPGMSLVGGSIPILAERNGKQGSYSRPHHRAYHHSASTMSSDGLTPVELQSPSALTEFIDRVRAVNSPRPLTSLTWQTDGVCSDVTIIDRVTELMGLDTMENDGIIEQIKVLDTVISIPTISHPDIMDYECETE